MKAICSLTLVMLATAAGCYVGEDEAIDSTAGASVSANLNNELTGCRGQASTSIPASGRYVITTFGGPGDHQSMSCGGYADGTGWYAASRQRYGCGSKLKMEANGKCVIAEALDYGPDACVERAAGSPIMDVSPRVAKALFGTSGFGWSYYVSITVTEVAESTPVGTCAAGGEPPAPPPGTAACSSETLGRDVPSGTCVQSASDAAWYACNNGNWEARSSSAGCAASYGYCDSATLGTEVAPRTCVQAASNSQWYQCNGQSWVTPVDTSAQSGPLGVCASWHPL